MEECYKNKVLLFKYENVGCYYCTEVFSPNMIKKWVDDGQTALCPFCETDSVIPEIDKTKLKHYHKIWFT